MSKVEHLDLNIVSSEISGLIEQDYQFQIYVEICQQNYTEHTIVHYFDNIILSKELEHVHLQ